MARFFVNALPDFSGALTPLSAERGLQSVRHWLAPYLSGPQHHVKPSVYTGAAGCAYTLWHAHRHAAALESVASEADLLGSAERYARAALQGIAAQPPERYGWALLAGHAGVYCAGALVLSASAAFARRQGREAAAAQLQGEAAEAVRHFCALQRLACSDVCEEDEVLYGRSGYLLGCLLLNRHLGAGSVPAPTMQAVVNAIIESGREAGRGSGSPLFYYWHDKPYLGAAHGMIGILFALLHVPDQVAAIPGAQADVEGALRYVLTLECDAEGHRGQGGHYPTQMGPWRDREPLVHWCHGATGAVLLFCKAHEQLGDPVYLAAAQRSGEAVWQRGLLKKGPGACHGVSGSAYALLRLYRSCPPGPARDKWLHRARQFALFMDTPEFKQGARTPDHPHSLYEGSAAAVCLWADLLGDPQRAGFPMFEIDI
ncbi:lanC 3 isoform X3 isoform A [Chlorella sorokiniana]|uniref:LanC 3 isoform X3 isoform A n=1 Tax=Chlorella sorokiniana TaxID=3076 RepID=A0A2P6TKW4_CHLSO|nr:lanC 3 isoform X3 isoform A [Chlorella sorokiniana]|eukprot:PRW44886.1 lanC 3 isoform X3 isoform A [Chlorella sorokiniana]